MTPEAIGFPAADLEAWACRVFTSAGLPGEDAAAAAAILIGADVRGVDSHGVVRLPGYVHRLRQGAINPRPRFVAVRDNTVTQLMDGDNGLGLVVGTHAMRAAIRRARECGVGVVGVRNSGHFGPAAHYAQLATAEGLIGMSFSNTGSAMAPWGGVTPVLGTNPFAFAAPGGIEGGVVVDMATSQVAWGKIMLAASAGQKIPLGWATDAAGRPTDDPNTALSGLMLPLGGHKGYGLALIVEVLCAMLTGAAAGPQVTEAEQGMGQLFIALEVAGFMPIEAFQARMAWLVAELHSGQLAEGATRIYVPGEIELETARRRRRDGIPLSADIVQSLAQLGELVGEPFPPATGQLSPWKDGHRR